MAKSLENSTRYHEYLRADGETQAVKAVQKTRAVHAIVQSPTAVVCVQVGDEGNTTVRV